MICTVPADTTQSFTDVMVPLPEGVLPTPILMKAGDVLFFNGSTVHGSYPNTSKDRFRRSLIAHYIVGDAQQVGEYYHPVLRMDGSQVELGVSEGGERCGVWVDQHGAPVIELMKSQILQREHE
jgi:phytanoyl-CoA hydroxylase